MTVSCPFTAVVLTMTVVWAGANNGSVYVWHGPSHTPLHELVGHVDQVNSLCPAAAGRYVLSSSSSRDGSVVTWSASGSCSPHE